MMAIKIKSGLLFWIIILVMCALDIDGQSPEIRVNCFWAGDLRPIANQFWRNRCEIPPGYRGLPGPKGDIGKPGIPGISILREVIVKGEPGDRGPEGKMGSVGPKGEPGDSSSINESKLDQLQRQVNEIRQKNKDTEGYGPPPKGTKGQRGQKGEPGATGNQGAKGFRGAQGPKGDKGEPTEDIDEIILDLQARVKKLESQLQECSCQRPEPVTPLVEEEQISTKSVNLTNFPPPPLPPVGSLRQKLMQELRKEGGECVSYALRYYSQCSEDGR